MEILKFSEWVKEKCGEKFYTDVWSNEEYLKGENYMRMYKSLSNLYRDYVANA